MDEQVKPENRFTIPDTPLRVIRFRRVDSTNLRAEALARSGEPAWSVIWAEEQTAGRGRFQRRWVSPAGLGLWFSLILRPQLSLREWSRISLLSALVVAEALEEKVQMAARGKTVGVKWPNDVFIGERKIGGVLLQNGRDFAGTNFLVVGIGINVNQRRDDFPEDLQETATSLFRETGMFWELEPLLREILERLYQEYRNQEKHRFSEIVSRFEQKMLFRDKKVEIKLPNKIVSGKIVKLSEEGFLILETDKGEVLVTAGDVGVLNEKGV